MKKNSFNHPTGRSFTGLLSVGRWAERKDRTSFGHCMDEKGIR